MCIWNKVLLGIIFIAGIAGFILGLRALEVQQVWREAAKDHEEKLLEAEQIRDERLFGVRDNAAEVTEPGVRQWQTRLAALMVARGRVWSDCTPQQVHGDERSMRVVVQTPSWLDPNGIADGQLLHLFESDIIVSLQPEADDESTVEQEAEPETRAAVGKYLGRFKVVGTDQQRVELQPAWRIDAAEFQAVSDSREQGRKWVLRDTLPTDDPAVLALLSEEEIRAMFPEETVEAYLVDPEKRTLRDYTELLDNAYAIRMQQETDLATLAADNQAMAEAVALATEQETFNQEQIDRLRDEIAVAKTQYEIIEAHRQRLGSRIAQLEKQIAQALTENEALTSEIAKIQYEALGEVDQRAAIATP